MPDIKFFSSVILIDTRAAQPAANSVCPGTLYFVTDEGVTERSDGATWSNYSDGPLYVDNGDSTGAVTVDLKNQIQKFTLTGDVTFTFASPTTGKVYTFLLVQDSTGGRSVTWPAEVKFSGGAFPLTVVGDAADSVQLLYDGTNYWELSRTGDTIPITIPLASADIQTLNSVPITLIENPGTGKFIQVLELVLFFNYGTTPYGDGGNMEIAYDGLAGSNLFTIAPAVYDAVASRVFSQGEPDVDNESADIEDKAIVLDLSSSDIDDKGAITTDLKNAPGMNYASGDTGTIDGGDGTAAYVIDTVDGGGAILTYHLTSFGSNYQAGTNVATSTGGAQPGVGTGFTVDIDVTPGDSTIEIRMTYRISAIP